MVIRSAEFVTSSPDARQCPPPTRPEYAFIGRSNVGKSSLINQLTNYGKLAKTSGTPGKTQLINHFLINDEWFLVDLPGYGYARAPARERTKWEKMNRHYLLDRPNLMFCCALIDSRLPPQPNDEVFLRWLGQNGVPFVIVFTKADKQSQRQTEELVGTYQEHLLQTWEELPPVFVTSAQDGSGREELLQYIETVNRSWVPPPPPGK